MARIGTGMSDDEDSPRLAFYQEDIEKIGKLLGAFLKNAGIRNVLLIDREGYLLTREGEASSYDADTLSGLVAGVFDATRRSAELLGERNFSVLYHQGERDNLQMFRVGRRTVLAVVFGALENLGMIRLYGAEVAGKLAELFDEIAKRGRGPQRDAP